MKAVEDENARLKKPRAEEMLDNAILKDVAAKMVTSHAKRNAVAHAREVHGVRLCRPLQALVIARSTVCYPSLGPDDAPLRQPMKAVAAERRRLAYQRFHVMLDRQGIVMKKKLRRLYREENLQVRWRGGRKRA